MKHIPLLLLLFTLCRAELYCQNRIVYAYDNAGNRVGRLQITTRAFSPVSPDEVAAEDSWEVTLAKVKLNIFPNPVQNQLFVCMSELPEPGKGRLELYDMPGKLLVREEVTSTQTVISMVDFPSGHYILRLFFGQMQSTWKIIKD